MRDIMSSSFIIRGCGKIFPVSFSGKNPNDKRAIQEYLQRVHAPSGTYELISEKTNKRVWKGKIKLNEKEN